ncbi:MAG: hypothetical protein ACI841_001714 [Planctomycetota bacterium]|jgi:hypothetical protein
MVVPATGVRRREVTALVTTFNEQDNIAACLETLTWCDKVLVVDSFSTDETPSIAQSFTGVRFLQHAYHGGAAQKNWALAHVDTTWVLIFDADERCTPNLRAEIEGLLDADPEAEAYVIRRRVFFLGKVIRHSGWRNDRVVRLFHAQKGRYQNRRVHSRVLLDGERPSMYTAPVLEQALDHYMVTSLSEYIDRTRRYSYWGAAQMWIDGRRTSASEIVRRSAWRFFRTYMLQRGFLDRSHGLVFCMLQAVGTYMKLATLWGWQQDQARGVEPDLPSFDDDQSIWNSPEEPESGASERDEKSVLSPTAPSSQEQGTSNASKDSSSGSAHSPEASNPSGVSGRAS